MTAIGEIRLNVRWLSVIDPLPHCTLEVVDFGDRVSIVVKRGEWEVALLSDLVTGDVAMSPPGVDGEQQAMLEYAIAVLRARQAVDGVELPPPGPPTTDLQSLASLAGVTWLTRDVLQRDQRSDENGM